MTVEELPNAIAGFIMAQKDLYDQVNLLETNEILLFKNSALKIIGSSLFHSFLSREDFSIVFPSEVPEVDTAEELCAC